MWLQVGTHLDKIPDKVPTCGQGPYIYAPSHTPSEDASCLPGTPGLFGENCDFQKGDHQVIK